jgi:uncharacterized membrane protein YhiD involved in acid resistance
VFASLSVGIASGVYGFAIAISGTAIFCVVAFALSFYHAQLGSSRENVIVFSLENSDDLLPILGLLENHSEHHQMLSVAHNKQGQFRYEFLFRLKRDIDRNDFFHVLNGNEKILNLRMSTKEDLETL